MDGELGFSALEGLVFDYFEMDSGLDSGAPFCANILVVFAWNIFGLPLAPENEFDFGAPTAPTAPGTEISSILFSSLSDLGGFIFGFDLENVFGTIDFEVFGANDYLFDYFSAA